MEVTAGFRGVIVSLRGYSGLQGVTAGYWKLQDVTRG